MVSAVLFLLAAFFLGASVSASFLTRKHKKHLKQQSEYWQSYWYDHFDDIRQTGLTREQMERLHGLYSRPNDM